MTTGVSPSGLRIFAVVATYVCFSAMSAVLPTASWAEGCPNEGIRLGETYASRLPDCRAYEQVSPIQKNLADAIGGVDAVQASPNGERVTFASVIPFPDVKASIEFPFYLSDRDTSADMESWSTSGLEPLFEINGTSAVLAATEDLSKVIVFSSAQPPLAPAPEGEETADGNYYIFDPFTGGYEFFLPGGLGSFSYVDATPDDLRILFQASGELVPCTCKGLPNLYEWHEGHISLIAKDAVGGPINYEGGEPGATGKYYTQNTISVDGSRIFFTSLETGQVYVYSRTLGKAIVVSPGSADWRASTPNGRYVFYTENEQLYRQDVEATEGANPSAGRVSIADEVIGLLGISADGSYAYYATKVGPTNGADVYEWHEGQTTFVVETDRFLDLEDWEGACGCNGQPNAEGEKSSRVSANGEDLLIASLVKLTSYDNDHHYELYDYHAPTAKLVCVSCNPTGASAVASSDLVAKTQAGFSARIPQYVLTRNLSEDGSRVIFETEEALLPHDVDHGMDVYEWEREGDDSCARGTGNGSGGCLYLISPGTSGTAEAYFGNADAEGNNVFFFTRQSLVGQDQDYDTDLYDARVGGGMKSQNEAPEPSCVSEEICRGAPSPGPQFNVPSSTNLSGTGNLVPVSERRPAPKPPLVKQKSRHKKKVKPKKIKAKRSHRAAKSDRRRSGRGM